MARRSAPAVSPMGFLWRLPVPPFFVRSFGGVLRLRHFHPRARKQAEMASLEKSPPAPVRPIQAKARLLVDRGWSGRFRAQGRLPVYFEASRPASATRIGRDRVPDSGWNHFGDEPLI